MFDTLKRIFVGRPLATAEQEHQRIPKIIALAVFSSDAISSTAYATEEILFVTAVPPASLDLGLATLVPIGLAVALVLTLVVSSYRQTVHAYPYGGGSYVVSRENLGVKPSLVAGASLLTDYILTVAVSISAGVAAIISIPAFQGLEEHRVGIGLLLILGITLVNLRGMKESGKVFAAPTYAYIIILTLLIAIGLGRHFFGNIEPVEFDPEKAENVVRTGGGLGLLLILRGFSSGAVALTGVEAISDGVPAFRRPESKNAATTLLAMALILGTLFFGTNLLATYLEPYPSHEETVFSQMGRAVFGEGPMYLFLQFATAGILTLAANTAYADFPRLCSIISRDGYLPRQFASRGDRLVFSNGIVFLAVAAGALLVAFGGITTALIPLYAVGVFTSFTLSQLGMVRHHQRHRDQNWRRGAAISAMGGTATFVVLVIVAVSKFAVGAWVPLVVVPAIIGIFLVIKRHYERVSKSLAVVPGEVRTEPVHHSVIVLVGRVHRGVLKALSYATSLRPDYLAAVYVSFDEDDQADIERQWESFGLDVPLEIIHSPYRELVDAVERYLDDLNDRYTDDTVTVLIPEFVVNHWYENILHNQSALQLKLALLGRKGTVVTSVPYHVPAKAPVGPGDGAGAKTGAKTGDGAGGGGRPVRAGSRSLAAPAAPDGGIEGDGTVETAPSGRRPH